MKVIKEGKLPESEIVQGECITCNAIIEFSIGEGQMGPDNLFSKIKCPTEGCHSYIFGYLRKKPSAEAYYNK
jgi:hypothetical protein